MGFKTSIIIQYNGESRTLVDWCKLLSLDYYKTHDRLFRREWLVSKAFTYKVKIKPPLFERFYSQIYHGLDGCWYWLGTLDWKKYGKIKHHGKAVFAHRVSYELHNGPIGDLYVLHRCDNPSCVNPNHLFLGTRADNNADMISKGRQVVLQGEDCAMAKLTNDQAHEIRSSNIRSKVLSIKYGVTATTIRDIRSGRRWKHITTPPPQLKIPQCGNPVKVSCKDILSGQSITYSMVSDCAHAIGVTQSCVSYALLKGNRVRKQYQITRL